MVLFIHTENASNLTNRYLGMFLEGQVDRQTDRQTERWTDGRRQNNIPPTSSGGGGWGTSTGQRIKCHVQEHNAVLQVRLDPATHRYRVKHSTKTALLS